jgi:hypothetical protein
LAEHRTFGLIDVYARRGSVFAVQELDEDIASQTLRQSPLKSKRTQQRLRHRARRFLPFATPRRPTNASQGCAKPFSDSYDLFHKMTPLDALDDCHDLRALEEVLRSAAALPESDRRKMDLNQLLTDMHVSDRIAKNAAFTDSATVVLRFARTHPRIAYCAETANWTSSPRYVAAILRVGDL